MALKLYVLYTTADNEIVWAQYMDDAAPPVPGAGQGVVEMDAAPASGHPAAGTHKIDPGPPAAVVDKTAGEQQAYADAALKKKLRMQIASLENCKDKFNAEVPPWDTTELQGDIDDLRAQHDALP